MTKYATGWKQSKGYHTNIGFWDLVFGLIEIAVVVAVAVLLLKMFNIVTLWACSRGWASCWQ